MTTDTFHMRSRFKTVFIADWRRCTGLGSALSASTAQKQIGREATEVRIVPRYTSHSHSCSYSMTAALQRTSVIETCVTPVCWQHISCSFLKLKAFLFPLRPQKSGYKAVVFSVFLFTSILYDVFNTEGTWCVFITDWQILKCRWQHCKPWFWVY